MPASKGAAEMKALGARLKGMSSSGDLGQEFGKGKTLRAQLLAGIRASTAPAIASARAAALSELPRKGGLNELVAGSKMKSDTRLGGKQVGVRISDRGKGAKRANRGVISHPVFGNRSKWVKQPIAHSGWFDKTMEAQREQVAQKIHAAMVTIAEETTRRLG